MENGYEKVMENGYEKVMEIDEKVMEMCDETFKIPRYLGVPRVRRSRGIRGRGLTNIGRGMHNSERPQPLVNPPYEEPKDWRKKYGAIQGIGPGRCLNYKNVYKELKYGTPLEQCLVGLLEYFKEKAHELLCCQATFMLQDDGSFKINSTDIEDMDTTELNNTLDIPSPVIVQHVGSSPSEMSEQDE